MTHDRNRPAPGPRLSDVPRTLLTIRRDRLAFVREMRARFGEVVCFRMGPKRVFLVSSASGAKHVLKTNERNYRKGMGLQEASPLLGRGLLTSEGEAWRSQHTRIQPLFAPDRLPALLQAMVEETSALLEAWEASAVGGAPVEVLGEMTRLTLRALDRTLLGGGLGDRVELLARALRAIARHTMTCMIFPFAAYLPTLENLRFRRALRRLDAMVYELLDGSSGREPRESILSVFPAGASGARTAVERKQLRDEVITLIVAGHETTAALLSWTWKLLAEHPRVQERVAREAAEVLGDGVPTPRQLGQLRYGRQVLQEVMRLYPPVWMLAREAIAADEIDGFHVPAGAAVLVCAYTLHRAPSSWSDPETFDPERFSPERVAQRPGFAYLPFGAGPRQCVGRHHGMAEALCVLGLTTRRFQLAPAAPDRGDAEPLLTLRPRSGIQVVLRSRDARDPIGPLASAT